MQNHTKVYMRFFGYQIAEDAICEITGEPCQDIHHINGRGPGRDVIENLIGLNRNEHDGVHWYSKYTKDQLQEIHNEFMKRHRKKDKRII